MILGELGIVPFFRKKLHYAYYCKRRIIRYIIIHDILLEYQ